MSAAHPPPAHPPPAHPPPAAELAPVTGAAAPPVPPQADRYGIADLTAAWLSRYAAHTRAAYVRDLADFLTWCQRERLDPATARAADIDRYRAGLEHPPPPRTPPGPATVGRRLSALSSWYRYLVANSGGAVGINPVAGARRPSVDRDASATVGLTTHEVQAVLRAADAILVARQRALARGATGQRTARHLAALRDRALVRLLADLGLRVGEALGLDVAALRHNRGRRTLRYQAKGGRTRERPLTPYASAALDDYLSARAAAAGVRPDEISGPLLATTGRNGAAGRLTEPAAFRLVRRLARRAGLVSADRLSPHSLRHAFATNARELGVPLEDVQDAMGHADARTTRRYDRGRYALERDPALRLGDLYAGAQPPPGTM